MSDRPRIFDPHLVRQRITRALSRPDYPDFLFGHVNAEICDRLALIKRQFATTLILSDHPAGLDERLRATAQHGLVITAGQGKRTDLILDYEVPPLAPESLNCILSIMNLHAIDDLPGALSRYCRALRPDGLFIAALLGAGSLVELRDAWLNAEVARPQGASPRVAPFADIRSLGGLLQHAGFALPVADSEPLKLTYENPLAAMREIKAMGWSNALSARSRTPVTRSLLARAAAEYQAAARLENGRVSLSLNILYLTGWAPHESQQKPLRPGSATMPLAEALKSVGK